MYSCIICYEDFGSHTTNITGLFNDGHTGATIVEDAPNTSFDFSFGITVPASLFIDTGSALFIHQNNPTSQTANFSYKNNVLGAASTDSTFSFGVPSLLSPTGNFGI